MMVFNQNHIRCSSNIQHVKFLPRKAEAKKTSSKRRVKKKVILSADDNIISDDPDVALELAKSISKTEAEEAEAIRKVHATHARIVTEHVPESARKRKSGKKVKKTSKRQLDTGGSNEGTSSKPRVTDESTTVSATSSEGTGIKPGVPDEEKDITKEKVILEWGDEQDSEYSDDDNDEVEKDDKDGDDDDDEGDDHISDTQDANDEDDEDEEMKDAGVKGSDKGDEEITDTAKKDAKKTSEANDDTKKIEFPPSSSSLSVSSALAVLQSYVPTVIDSYLETKVGDHLPELTKKPTATTEQESEKGSSEILKIKKEQAESQKNSHFTIKSAEKADLEEYDLKSALYQSMHANKSFNINPTNHRLYHTLMETLIEDENAMDKGVADTVKDHKRKHDDNEDNDNEHPPAGPNQGKKTKRRRIKESV
ncbi:hypothetical protein Tco_0776561 [Tanacetum coccineum]